MPDEDSLAHAGALFEQARYDEAREWAHRALEERERMYGPSDPRVGEALCRLGAIYEYAIDEELAAGFFARALAIYDATLGPDDLALADLLRDYANARCTRRDEHVAMLARALEIYERVFGPRDLRVARAWLMYAEACKQSYRTPEARAAVERALECSDDNGINASADEILRGFIPDRARLGSDAPPGWIDGKSPATMSPIGSDLMDIARDARLEGRHADARQIERDALANLHEHAARIAESNLGSLACFGKFAHDISGFSFSRDGARLALVTAAGIHVIRTTDLAIERFVEANETGLCADLAGHGSRILLREEGHVFVFSADDGSFVEYRGYPNTGWVGIGPDDDLFAIGSSNKISIARLSAPGLIREIVPGAGNGVRVAFLDGGATIAAANYGGPIQRWRVADGEPLPTLPVPASTRSFDLAPTGDIVASDSNDVVIVRTSDGSVRRIHTGHQEYVRAVAVSPDGALVATAGYDLMIFVFRTADGQKLHSFELDASRLQFSPDGRFLAIQNDSSPGPFWLYGVPA